MTQSSVILRFRSPDRPGIMAGVAPFLARHGCDIRDAQLYGDPDTGTFFQRILLKCPISRQALASAISPLAKELLLDWELFDAETRMRVIVAVSKFGHCLTDLIHKSKIGQIPIDIVGVVSNHQTLRPLVEWHGLAFHYLPTDQNQASRDSAFMQIVTEADAELTILARYMQILSRDVVEKLEGRCINIHHSFLPSFKGAKPYHQAYARGVKIIGATAHYVTAALDEGPIIEQGVHRVDHAVTADNMVAIGREIESSVLARAVAWHANYRVFINGDKTIVLA